MHEPEEDRLDEGKWKAGKRKGAETHAYLAVPLMERWETWFCAARGGGIPQGAVGGAKEKGRDCLNVFHLHGGKNKTGNGGANCLTAQHPRGGPGGRSKERCLGGIITRKMKHRPFPMRALTEGKGPRSQKGARGLIQKHSSAISGTHYGQRPQNVSTPRGGLKGIGDKKPGGKVAPTVGRESDHRQAVGAVRNLE